MHVLIYALYIRHYRPAAGSLADRARVLPPRFAVVNTVGTALAQSAVYQALSFVPLPVVDLTVEAPEAWPISRMRRIWFDT